MADFETDIAEQLIQIFPNLSREIIDISIKHPSNRSTPLNVAYLVQNCIDDLLELRTFSETTGTKRSNETNNKNERESSVASTSSEKNLENSYRDNPYVIHSDDSNDEDMVQFAEKVDAGLFQDISAKSSPNDCIITNPTITTSENVVLQSNIQTTVKYSAKVSNSPQVSPIKKPTFTYSSPLKKMQTNVGDPPSDVSPSAWNEWRKIKDSEIDSELPTLISPSAMKKKQRKVSEDNNKNYGRNNNSNKSTAPAQKIIKSKMPRTLINNALLNNETQVWNGQKDVNALSNFAIQPKGQNQVESVIVPGKQLKRTYENTSVSNNISETITLSTNPLVGDNKNKAEVAISSSTHGNKLSNEDGKCNILQKKQCSTAPGNKILPNFSKAEVRNSGEIPGVKVNSSRPSGISYRTPTYLNESESTDSSSEDDEFPEEKVTFQEVVKTENVKQLTSNRLDLEATLNDLYNFSHGSQTQQRGNISNNTQDITNKSKNNIPSSQGTDTYKALSQRKETNSAVTTPTQLSRTNQSSDSNVKNSVVTVSKGGAPKIFRTVTHDTDTVDNQNPKRNLPSNSALDLNKSTPGSDIDRRGFDMKPKKAETITTTTEDTFVIDNPRPGCSQNNSRSNRVKYETEIKQDTCVLKIKRVIETNPTQNACPVSVSTSCTILSSNNNNSLNLDKQNNPSNLPNNLSLNHRKNIDVLQQGNDGYNGRDKMTTNLLGIGTNVLDNRHDKKTMRGNDSHKEMKIKQAIDTSSTQTTNKVVNVENLDNGWLNVTAVKGQKNNVPMVDLTKNERDLPTAPAPVNQILIPEPTVLVPEPAILIPEPDPEELTPEKKVLALFPDVDPDYLKRLINCGNDVNNICNHLLEINYPKKQQRNIDPVLTLQQKTKSTKNYYNDYSDFILDKGYVIQCETILQNEFKWISVRDIRIVLKHFHGHYAPSHNVLRQVMLKRQKDLEKDLKPNSGAKVETTFKVGEDKEYPMTFTFLKCPRTRRYLSTIVPDLQEEIDFVADSLLEIAEESDRQLAAEINEHEYEDTGQLIECGCCYGEIAFENMVQCYEGHLFCQDCLKNYAKESVFGQGKADLLCMTEGCDASFPVSQLSKAVPSNILEKYEDRVKEENINLADLADLVRCPHCEFAALMDPGDKVFTCQNTTCMKETCRYCKEEWNEHFGKRCEEIEKKDETKLRLEFEEKMTEVQIRTCHRCKARFTKSEGCNKMTCRCGASMCYICRQPDISYKHFCQHVRNPGKPCDQCEACFLWSNPEEDEKRAIEEIRKQANEARIEKGYIEEKFIGAKDLSAPPMKKPRLG